MVETVTTSGAVSENNGTTLSVLALDLAVLLALVPKRVLGVSREEAGLDLVTQNVVQLQVYTHLDGKVGSRNG